MTATLPKPRMPKGTKLRPEDLAAGRYGTIELVQRLGPERTFEYSLKAQSQASKTLSRLHPDIVPPALAEEISSKADLQHINPGRIRELEEKKGHDVIAINMSLEEQLSEEAKPHIGKARTSADTTQSAKALQIKESLDIIADSARNLRQILEEKAAQWKGKNAGKSFEYFSERLLSCLNVLRFFQNFSTRGKWGDATGNHHSATTLGIDGIKLQEEYCKDLGINYMIAAAQVPGREFDADSMYVLARIGETLNNIAKFVRTGRGDDMDVFVYVNPEKKKGSSAMPHKDAKNGNPTTEEQNSSARNYLVGNLITSMLNCEMDYARDLNDSANSRINLEDGFKFADHAIRTLAETVYWTQMKEGRDTNAPSIAEPQFKKTLETIAGSVENLRDELIHKAVEWMNVPHMDQTHNYDALPTVAGRPFAHYAEMLQSSLEILKFFHDFPESTGREFDAERAYALARIGETINNITNYVENGANKGFFTHDALSLSSPRDRLNGILLAAMINCDENTKSPRIDHNIAFATHIQDTCADIEELTKTLNGLNLKEERCRERIDRSYGCTTAEQVLTYLTDKRYVKNPMARSEAHDLIGKLATQAWDAKTQFTDVLLQEPEVTVRVQTEALKELTDPYKFIGQSKEIISEVAKRYHKKKTFEG